jgi:hypothetical protein
VKPIHNRYKLAHLNLTGETTCIMDTMAEHNTYTRKIKENYLKKENKK